MWALIKGSVHSFFIGKGLMSVYVQMARDGTRGLGVSPGQAGSGLPQEVEISKGTMQPSPSVHPSCGDPDQVATLIRGPGE